MPGDRQVAAAALVATKADDGGRKVYTFLASNDTLDRQGEVVTADGWEIGHYQRNPVILDGHDYRSIESIVGRAMDVRSTGDGLEADIAFNATPKGQLAASLVESGDLRAVSVGFRPIEMAVPRDAREPVRHTRKELMEISVVPVPANPDALRLRALAGGDDAGDGEPGAKAGRVLSAKNEARLRQALGLLSEVLEQIGDADSGAAEAADDKAADADAARLDEWLTGLTAVVGKLGV